MFEKFTHKEETQMYLDRAEYIYDSSKKAFESQKEKTAHSLEELGKIKIRAWSEGMEAFVSSFGAFKNVQFNQIEATNTHFLGYDEEPTKMLVNIKSASAKALEVVSDGFLALGSGALVGVAAYGGVMMFGKTSTGTAIASLSGAAKKNATLAWFGGGAKAAGGLGIQAGKLILCGIVIAPILAVAALIAGAKGKARLAEAKKICAEAEQRAAEMDTVTIGMKGIEKMSDNYCGFIKKLNKKFVSFVKELERIKSVHTPDQDGYIDFDGLTKVEQETLHLSWLLAQTYYHVLATQILTSNGEVSEEAREALSAASLDLKQLRKNTFRMVGVDAPVGNLYWKSAANKMTFANLFMMAFFAAIGILVLGNSIVKGVLFIACSLIACPFFFVFRDLPSSRLYAWRWFRLIVSVFVFLAIAILV